MEKFEKLKNKYLQKAKDKKGFTLIELIIVIVIIGILVAIAMSDMSRNTEDAKIARAKEDLRVLSGAAQLYDTDTGLGSALDGKKQDDVCTVLQKTATKIDGTTGGPWIKTCPKSPWNDSDYVAKVSTSDNKVDISFSVSNSNGITIDSNDLSTVTKK